ncbi:MAG: hypothetical protein FJY07_13490 [Bacteroidetes bacterium]|nr:hypothetical protein [Bacteroidota bacterium]
MKAKFFLAGLAGAVVTFFLGWLVYGELLMGFYVSNTTHYDGLVKEMPDMLLLVLSNLVGGYFFAFIFSYWAKINTWIKGFSGGLILGLFFVTMFDLSFLSMWNLYNAKVIIVDILVGGVFYGIVGAVVGGILGLGSKSGE